MGGVVAAAEVHRLHAVVELARARVAALLRRLPGDDARRAAAEHRRRAAHFWTLCNFLFFKLLENSF